MSAVMDAPQLTTPTHELKRFSVRAVIRSNALLLGMALIKFLLHLATSANYGVFLDEFYYIDAGKHLSLGYVDYPAFMGLIAAIAHVLFGSSLTAYRVFPALSGALIVLLAGLITREVGGKSLAQFLVALATLISPEHLWLSSTLTTGSFDPLWWTLAIYVLVLIMKREQPGLWLLFGLVVGLGFLTKLTIFAFVLAIVGSLLLTPQRKYLFSTKALIGGAIALVFLVPYLIWNAANGWPTVEFYQVYSKVPSTVLSFFGLQLFMVSPIVLPLWGIGLYRLFFSQEMRTYRAFGWMFVMLYVLFTATQANFYFLAPAYIVPLAAGAILIERHTQALRWRWVRPTYVGLMLLVGILMMPYSIPVLPLQFFEHMSSSGKGSHVISLKGEPTNTPQLPYGFEQELGWDSMAATVGQVYHSLPVAEQSKSCVLALRYGEAGALDYYSVQDHLPQVISGHNSYYYWGPGNCTGEVIIAIGYPLNLLQHEFSSVRQAAVTSCQYCMSDFNHLPVYVCYHIKTSMKEEWVKFKFIA